MHTFPHTQRCTHTVIKMVPLGGVITGNNFLLYIVICLPIKIMNMLFIFTCFIKITKATNVQNKNVNKEDYTTFRISTYFNSVQGFKINQYIIKEGTFVFSLSRLLYSETSNEIINIVN